MTSYVYIFWINNSKNISKINSKNDEKYIGTHILSKNPKPMKKVAINDDCLKLELIWLRTTCHL